MYGAGAPLVILHGGWGCEMLSIRSSDRGAGRRAADHRPRSQRLRRLRSIERGRHRLPPSRGGRDICVIDALGLDPPVSLGTQRRGGRSRCMMALEAPDRIAGVIVEATHFFRRKPASRAFFETMRDRSGRPRRTSHRGAGREHGESWRDLISHQRRRMAANRRRTRRGTICTTAGSASSRARRS